MLYHLLYPLREVFSFLNIFRYITFRAAGAVLCSFVVTVVLMPPLIKKLKKLKIGENIRKEDSSKLYELHSGKQDTPTMGGILILFSVVVSTVLWADMSNSFIQLCLFSTVWLGITGLIDDCIKQARRHSQGLSVTAKFTSQILLGLVLGLILFIHPENSTRLDIPFLKGMNFDLGVFYVLFVIFVISGFSNAVNLTDGLDGLAVGNVIMVGLAFSVLSYVSGNIKFSSYLFIPYIKPAGELAVFCASLLGASLGFLWFNCYPASIFMGDVGSLALGGALATVALLVKKELLLAVMGGVFVLEALSVILQVGSFRITKKRIFKIAPLHHHFQFLGWPESKVIVRFWIVASILALLTLITLKVR